MVHWKRTLRTASSERFVAVRDQREVAMADIHFAKRGIVSGTVVLFEQAGWREEEVPDLLSSLDEQLLPDVDLADGNLTYMVVQGRILGSFEVAEEAADRE